MHHDYYRFFKISYIEFLLEDLKPTLELKAPFYLKINNDYYYYGEKLNPKICSDFPIHVIPVGNAADTYKTTISIVDGSKEEVKVPYRIHFDKHCSKCNYVMYVTNIGLEWKPKFLRKVDI